jgi:gas vesicle protein
MSQNIRSTAGGLLAAFAIGAALGAGIALLYAPQSGKATRGMLADKGRNLGGRAKGALREGKDFIAERRLDLSEAVDGGREAMRQEQTKHQTRG